MNNTEHILRLVCLWLDCVKLDSIIAYIETLSHKKHKHNLENVDDESVSLGFDERVRLQ